MKKKNRNTFFIVSMVTLFILVFSVTIYAAEYKIRVANPVAPDHSWGRAAVVFKEEVEKSTGGKIAVDVHHAGALGKVRETMEMVRMGTLESALGGVAHIQRNVPELGITVLPFLWKDLTRLFEVLDGPNGKELDRRLLAAGFFNLGFFDNGFRHVTNNRKPILTVEDLKGLKIRTLPTPVHIAFFKALGASPTPMDWTELFEALRTGVVDAQENPPAMVYTAKFQEVQKFYSLTAHVNEVGAFVMSKTFYEKLPKDLQSAVEKAARKAALWQRVENEKDNQKFLKELEKAGMKINTIPEGEMERFRKIAHQVYPDAVKDFGKDGKELTDKFIAANK
ncbi:MAG: TRAP transporter substrate-binding protein [Thermodesulfobacteriota bacterium]|nr:TRAP transporter substrate-binding protein [Thermodesulfobacteriota bacterium]